MKARITVFTVTAVLCTLASLAGSARALAAPPANDNFGAPTVIASQQGTLNGANKGTNAEATKEVGEPNHAGDPGAPQSGTGGLRRRPGNSL